MGGTPAAVEHSAIKSITRYSSKRGTQKGATISYQLLANLEPHFATLFSASRLSQPLFCCCAFSHMNATPWSACHCQLRATCLCHPSTVHALALLLPLLCECCLAVPAAMRPSTSCCNTAPISANLCHPVHCCQAEPALVLLLRNVQHWDAC
jgi:hypothetical protein